MYWFWRKILLFPHLRQKKLTLSSSLQEAEGAGLLENLDWSFHVLV